MNITELKKNDTELHVKITIPAKDIGAEIEKELNKVAKTVKIDGFRAGKVPVSIVKKKYETSIRMDIVKNQVMKSIEDISKERDLRPVGDPKVDDLQSEDGKDLEFTLQFELLPKIEMPDFGKISLEKPILEVKDKDLQEQLEKMASFSKDYDKQTKAKAKNNDQLTIDAVGYVDGNAFAGGKLDDHKLVLGSNTFIPGFEDQLIGSKEGDEVTVKAIFPKDYHASELAGKPSEFKVKVKAVHQPTEPKIDDDFAKNFKCETLDELKEKIKENLISGYGESIHTVMKMKLFDKLETMLKFDAPESLLEREISVLKEQTEKEGVDDAEIKGKSDEEKEKYYQKLAARRVKIGLMLAEYVKTKKLEIEQKDIHNAIMKQIKHYPGQEQQILDFYQKDPKAADLLKGPVLEEKAVENIFTNEIKLTEKTYEKDKLQKMLEKNSV